MASEAFLINPKRKRKVVARKKTVRKVVVRKAHRAKRAQSRIGELSGLRRHRPVMYETADKVWTRSPLSKSRQSHIRVNPFGRFSSLRRNRPMLSSRKRSFNTNPFGEEVMIVGANPKRRKINRKSRSKMRHNPLFGLSGLNPRRRRFGSIFKTNPKKRRSIRRNPVNVGAIAGNVTSALPLVATGVVGAVAANTAPKLLKTTGYMSYGVQAAVIAGGSFVVGKYFGKEHGKALIIC